MKAFAEHKGIGKAAALSGLKLNVGSTYGTIAGDASSDVNSETPADFDGEKFTGGAKFGYFGKTIARDIEMARRHEDYCRRKTNDP